MPDVNPHLAKGLEFSETIVKLRKDASPHVIIDVHNFTDHGIMLTGRTVIGTVQEIKSVYPAINTPVAVNTVQTE